MVAAHAQGLMPGRVSPGGEADDGAVAEEVVLAVDYEDVVPQVVVARVVVVGGDLVGLVACIPLPSLHDQLRAGNLVVAAAVIEVEVRVDEVADVTGVDAERGELRAHLVARAVFDVEHRGEGAEPRRGIVLEVHMEPAVEEDLPLRMVDQVAGRRDAEAADARPRAGSRAGASANRN